MAPRKLKKIVRYGNVSADYLQRRQLKRGIGFWLLFGSGIGIVIDGIYSGWNEGLAQGGFWGMSIATALIAMMYLSVTFSMAELSAALPHAGGFYAFTRTAFGAVGGFICGLAELLEYILIMTGYPACIYAYSRVFFAMSRAGYLPQGISVTNDRGIPARAAILGGALALGITVLFVLLGGEDSSIGLGLVTVSVVSALVTYILVLASYVKLQVDRPGMPRPYRSPVGILGAFIGLVIATIAFIACFTIEEYRIAVYVTVGLLALASVYFFFVSRNQLVAEAPEEQLALADDTTVISP
ncbi:MAG: amino acid permease [Cyanobacteria bacterium KgW148]|nr:amino acid permease [Cyanobacteria bacterium KgW148]